MLPLPQPNSNIFCYLNVQPSEETTNQKLALSNKQIRLAANSMIWQKPKLCDDRHSSITLPLEI